MTKTAVKSAAVISLLVVPWLIEPNAVPSPAAWQWFASAACMGAFLIFLPVPGSWAEPNGVRLIAAAWLVAALLNTVIAFMQYFGIDMHFSWISQADPGTAFGNLRQSNQYATLTNIGLAAILWTLGQNLDQQKRGAQETLLHLIAAVLAAGNAASASRTGVIGILLLFGLTIGWHGVKSSLQRSVIATAMVVYGVSLLWLTWLNNGLAGARLIAKFQHGDDGCSSRLLLWSNMLELIGKHPWSGWGWGELDYAHFITQYQGGRQCEMLDNAHNLPLHLAVELGLPVALICGTSIFWYVWRARPWSEENNSRKLAWSVLALIALHSMVEYPLWYGPFQMALALGIGLLWVTRPTVETVSALNIRKARHLQRGLALILVAFTAYGAWDYWRVSQIYLPPEQRAEAYSENTLEKIRGSWLFADQVRFAEYTLTPTTPENAGQLHEQGLKLLHFSPEPRVVEKLIENAVLLGQDEDARFYLSRYKSAYPQEHARWGRNIDSR